MPRNLTAMKKRSEVYMSTWGMLRRSQMEEEIGKSLSL
jgi:hypothetical protein